MTLALKPPEISIIPFSSLIGPGRGPAGRAQVITSVMVSTSLCRGVRPRLELHLPRALFFLSRSFLMNAEVSVDRAGGAITVFKETA